MQTGRALERKSTIAAIAPTAAPIEVTPFRGQRRLDTGPSSRRCLACITDPLNRTGTMRSNTVLVATIALTLAAAACGKKESYGTGGSTGATGAAGGTAAAAPAAGASASAATQALTDPNIVYILDQANSSDSARGRLAESKATSADVKGFGRLMVGEHHALRQAGQALAKKLNVTPQPPSGDQSEQMAKQELDSLNAMPKGKAWDKAYIDYEVTYHEQVIATAQKALAATQNADLKALIQKAAPVLQKHLDRAKQIQSKLGS